MRICFVIENEDLSFAAEELGRYMKMIWNDEFLIAEKQEDESFPIYLETEKGDGEFYHISFDGKSGRISADGRCSVLIASYELLKEIGFFFPSPGVDIIPQSYPGSIRDVRIERTSRASYRYRGVVLEGANSIENVLDMIDFLPKASFNTYFIQLENPYTFFSRWYAHQNNPREKKEDFSPEDGMRDKRIMVKEITKRGLMLHEGGHTWTTRVLKLSSLGWDECTADDYEKSRMALIDGKRDLFQNRAINTNPCYSDERNIDDFVKEVIAYAERNKDCDVLHIWLADGYDNYCECDRCSSVRPSDQYADLLNRLDKALTERGNDVKLSILLYYELLWPPEKVKIENPDRFIMMFAPITRSYESSYESAQPSAETAPYIRNRITLPVNLNDNLAYLSKWQKTLKTDCFDFEYYLWNAHFGDPGNEKSAEIIVSDIKSLKRLNMNGMLSCQQQRASFPSALPLYLMGKTLWNRDTSFNEAADEYYQKTYGLEKKKAAELRRILRKISAMFNMDYVTGKDISWKISGKEAVESLSGELKTFIERNADTRSEMWKRINFLPEYVILLHAFIREREEGKRKGRGYRNLVTFLQENERRLQKAIDVYCLINLIEELSDNPVKPSSF